MAAAAAVGAAHADLHEIAPRATLFPLPSPRNASSMDVTRTPSGRYPSSAGSNLGGATPGARFAPPRTSYAWWTGVARVTDPKKSTTRVSSNRLA